MSHYSQLGHDDHGRGGGGGYGGSYGGPLGSNAQISDKIHSLSKKNSQLERMLVKLGTKGDNEDFRDRLLRQRTDAKQLCQQIIVALKDNRSRHADRRVMKKLSAQFQECLEAFTQINQQIERKEQQIVTSMSQSKPARGALETTSYQTQDQDLDIQFQVYDLEQIQQRNQDIQSIERDVLEVADMMKDLKMLVDEQGESVDVIEHNVMDARDQVEAGTGELRTAEEYQKKARKRQCCILFIVMAVILVVILAVVVLKKK